MSSSTALRQLTWAARQVSRQYHAPFRIGQPVPLSRRHLAYITPTSILRTQPHSKSIAHQIRQESSEAKPLTDRPASTQEDIKPELDEVAARKAQEPAYQLTFTCRKCMERSSHRITKQGYHFGTTLISCPGCKNRHLISDHMKIFSDKSITLEDILREKGQFLRKGRLGEDGDVEFYDETNNEIGREQARMGEEGP